MSGYYGNSHSSRGGGYAAGNSHSSQGGGYATGNPYSSQGGGYGGASAGSSGGIVYRGSYGPGCSDERTQQSPYQSYRQPATSEYQGYGSEEDIEAIKEVIRIPIQASATSTQSAICTGQSAEQSGLETLRRLGEESERAYNARKNHSHGSSQGRLAEERARDHNSNTWRLESGGRSGRYGFESDSDGGEAAALEAVEALERPFGRGRFRRH